ncbi:MULTISPECIES: amidohydrolase family protein [Marinobacter]|jgi:N-acyl-D-aspartate/D-glutamate deacylase|uniref:N-acyl-D-amino-acid deacylase family protein n=2 Tax=Marinobacteraceae TaxID=2887365 RepID=UPI0029436322|nr:amidohydrolase family protein [Marinobacter salarius]WOI21045.1 amidohydrolase family protein [Marinobacter salarius]
MSDTTPDTVWDYLIQGAKVFDGIGELPVREDIAIADGRVAARGPDLDPQKAHKVIDATERWAMPGLFDIHTHYDLELEVAPGLPESVRHGTTTVVIANCSLGLAFGAQRKDGADPIVDCYARVENIPKDVLRATADRVDWKNPKEYIQHLNRLSLGPNLVTMVPHSMLRIEVMGFDASISRDPTEDELNAMEALLEQAMDDGYAGFSTDALPFHYLANQPNTRKTIPTQFAKYPEIKRLTDVVRRKGGVWQATPPKDSTMGTIKTFLLSCGLLHGKPLRTTVVAALDVQSNRKIVRLARLLARVLNSRLLRGDFHLQALAAPFKVWSDGAVTPLSEEIEELRILNETELEDRESRLKILNDPAYIASFKAMWMSGKTGFGLKRLKRLVRLEDYAFNRTLADMTIDVCPLREWQGHTFADVFARVNAANAGKPLEGSDAERALLKDHFSGVKDEGDFVLAMLRAFDRDLSWYTVSANRNERVVRNLLMDRQLLPGFNDSGAHLTNMAFYDGNLRALKLASDGGDIDVAYMVRRLTRDPARVFGVKGGGIEVGDQADLILVDPSALRRMDHNNTVQRQYREAFQHEQLVNRTDGVVPLVMIAGHPAWHGTSFDNALGQKKMGTVLDTTF